MPQVDKIKQVINLEHHKGTYGRMSYDGINCSSEIRGMLFNQILPVHADINNGLFTVISNEARMILESGCYLTPARRKRTEKAILAVQNYTKNKEHIRNSIAIELDLPIDDVKSILIGSINGARLVPNVQHCAAYATIFKCNYSKWEKLTKNNYYTELKSAGKELWDIIFNYKEKALNIPTPKSRKSKMQIYMHAEAIIRNSANDFLRNKSKDVLFVHEHDAFRTDKPFIKSELEKFIYQNTGYISDWDIKHSKHFNTVSVRTD
jgi:hypothetical protein